jgi:hypothetical protein
MSTRRARVRKRRRQKAKAKYAALHLKQVAKPIHPAAGLLNDLARPISAIAFAEALAELPTK